MPPHSYHPVNGSAKFKMVFTRSFAAAPEAVFRAWTDPVLMARWWGPHGFTNPVCRLDPRPGGAILIDMRAPDGMVFPMKGVFHEISGPGLLVFDSSAFEDEEGRPQLEVRNTVIFANEEGRTRLTLQAAVFRSGPAALEAIDTLEDGWNQSLDRLDQTLRGSLAS